MTLTHFLHRVPAPRPTRPHIITPRRVRHALHQPRELHPYTKRFRTRETAAPDLRYLSVGQALTPAHGLRYATSLWLVCYLQHLLHQHPGSPFPLYTIVAEKYLHPYTQRFRARETAVSDLRDNTSLSLLSTTSLALHYLLSLSLSSPLHYRDT